MITTILCWVLFSKGIIGLALPIISTIFSVINLVFTGIRICNKVHEIE